MHVLNKPPTLTFISSSVGILVPVKFMINSSKSGVSVLVVIKATSSIKAISQNGVWTQSALKPSLVTTTWGAVSTVLR